MVYNRLQAMVIRAWNNYLTMPQERETWAAIYLLLAEERDLYLDALCA